MKKIIVVLGLLLSVGGYGFSQLNHTEKIIEVYGFDWFNQMNTNNPDVLVLLDQFADHGFAVQEIAPGKAGDFKPLQTIPLRGKTSGSVTVYEFMDDFTGGDFNPLRYDFFPSNVIQCFKLEGTNYVIYILTQETILQKNNVE